MSIYSNCVLHGIIKYIIMVIINRYLLVLVFFLYIQDRNYTLA